MIEVTAWPRSRKGATFEQETRTPMGKSTTTFVVDDLSELREIKLRCLTSGYYSHWLLTEARGETFAEVEIGMDRSTSATRPTTPSWGAAGAAGWSTAR